MKRPTKSRPSRRGDKRDNLERDGRQRCEGKAARVLLRVMLPRLNIYKVIVVDYASTKPPPAPKMKSDRRGLDF